MLLKRGILPLVMHDLRLANYSFFLTVLLIASVSSGCAEAAERGKTGYPIRISANERYFEDQAGKPVLIHGDSAWSLIAQLNIREANYYLSHRRAQGFNSILVNLIEKKFAMSPPRNAAGDQPFITPGDLTTPNESYFAHADAVLSMAARESMLVFLVPAYLGWEGGDEGWFREMQAAGAEKVRQYGRFVGSRYRTFSNIVWVVGGDYTPPRQYQWCVDALAEGIREGGATQLMTAHCGHESPAAVYGDRKWLDFNNVYSYARNLHADTLKEYQRLPVKPYILIESLYENENHSTRDRIRAQAYGALLAGAAGHFFGNNPVWNFDSPQKVFPAEQFWREALDSQSARDMMRLGSFWRSLSWNTLVPDAEHRFVVAGYGHSADERYSLAAVSRDGKLAIAYVSNGAPKTISLDLKKSPKGYKAIWIDPTNGDHVDIDMPTGTRGGRKEVTTPGKNSSGADDWILYFQTK
jgi:hypothetical protein